MLQGTKIWSWILRQRMASGDSKQQYVLDWTGLDRLVEVEVEVNL
jgi:hypothetical protein